MAFVVNRLLNFIELYELDQKYHRHWDFKLHSSSVTTCVPSGWNLWKDFLSVYTTPVLGPLCIVYC